MKILRVNHNNAAEAVAVNAGYCPCKLDKNDDTKCMCKQFRDQVARKEPGECECGLYELVGDDADVIEARFRKANWDLFIGD